MTKSRTSKNPTAVHRKQPKQGVYDSINRRGSALRWRKTNKLDPQSPKIILSDDTKVHGTVWANLKEDMMKEDYSKHPRFTGLSDEDKIVIELLRVAQKEFKGLGPLYVP